MDGESILAPKLVVTKEGGGKFARIWSTSFYSGVTHKRLTVLVTATASPLGPMTDVWDVPWSGGL